MPQYGITQYGIEKYGRYQLGTPGGSGAIGPFVRYRIRTYDREGKMSEFVTLCKEWVSMPAPSGSKIRVRSNNGEWVYTQQETIPKQVFAVRIRSIDSNGNASEWVVSEVGEIKEM